MGVTVLCGLALGLVLNLVADWLPPRVQPKPDDVPPRAERDNTRLGWQRWGRWAALLFLSVALMWQLRSSATASLHLLGEAAAAEPSAGRSWLAGALPELAYCSLLLLIGAIDLEHRLVPNVLILAGLILATCFSLLTSLPALLPWNGVPESRHVLGEGIPGLATALMGAAVGGGIFLLLALARRNAMGAGDVKLAFLIGMLTGFPGVLQALVVGILLGGLAAAVLLLLRLRGPKQYIPYAPYLVAGAMATLLYGQHIAQWYARLAACGVRLALPLLRPAMLAGLARLAGVGG